MSVGLILLIVAGLLVLLGVGQRVLDKLRLTDKQALLFIALIKTLSRSPIMMKRARNTLYTRLKARALRLKRKFRWAAGILSM